MKEVLTLSISGDPMITSWREIFENQQHKIQTLPFVERFYLTARSAWQNGVRRHGSSPFEPQNFRAGRGLDDRRSTRRTRSHFSQL